MNTLRHTTVRTDLGAVTFVAEGDDVVGCRFDADTSTCGDAVAPSTDSVLGPAVAQFREYLDGDRTEFELSIRTDGDEFHERVWAVVRTIPFGDTVSYGEIASRLGDPGLARRVGRAVGANPIGVFIPCHRVIGADGSLTGYGGGLARKRHLLDLEESPETRASRLF
ncbi:methylated-DNA--[protein]-cysteine S-methyltransferase [Gordonia sp. CPCC 206044]|uniref:methylated-DNA--[protein]-cysteine S-methyltransferase n=1 Tax=Gordonia sp. CPCC 206044 TaxID=3140793 RepID=UPI003AF35B02